MNKSVKKCCICNNKQIGEFITIEDKKYHLCCIEELQENYKAVLKQRDDTNKSAVETIEKYQHNWNELKKYIEKEKDRVVKGTSHTYEDSLGKINYVNEDIYIKLVKVLNKMYELEGGNNE